MSNVDKNYSPAVITAIFFKVFFLAAALFFIYIFIEKNKKITDKINNNLKEYIHGSEPFGMFVRILTYGVILFSIG
tara:strand:+ start:1825 stop:2052 length:228 start_codon:yes stop_codon:yes gene_type:complete